MPSSPGRRSPHSYDHEHCARSGPASTQRSDRCGIGGRSCWRRSLHSTAHSLRTRRRRGLWEFVHRPEDTIDVTLESEFTPKRRGLHRTTILPDEDRTVRSDIPCTTFERTLCDCTTLLSPFQLGRVLDDGLRRGEASLAKLQKCAARLDSGPGRRLRSSRDCSRSGTRPSIRAEALPSSTCSRSSETPGCPSPSSSIRSGPTVGGMSSTSPGLSVGSSPSTTASPCIRARARSPTTTSDSGPSWACAGGHSSSLTRHPSARSSATSANAFSTAPSDGAIERRESA